MIIREARPEEAEALSALAMESKAYWGYDEAFMESCRLELALSADDIRGSVTYVLEDEGALKGFYRLSHDGFTGELNDLFLLPDIIGHKWGRAMWNHLADAARQLGIHSITLDADPFAEGFYLKMGCRRMGMSPSLSFPGRYLPVMGFNLN